MTALLTGDEYLEGLRDGRAVFIDGERVTDVTEHTAFRNSARSIARLYDALHDPEQRETLVATDRHGIDTHRFFMPSYSSEELLAAREAIAAWSRLTYGFMGRTPDYKASFMATLGASPEFYAPFEDNARRWYERYAREAQFLNHVLINPPIDRNRAAHEVEDVYVHVVEERDDGIVVDGAKMLATGSALTHATFVAQNSAVQLEPGKAEDYALVFIAPMHTPGPAPDLPQLLRGGGEVAVRQPALVALRRERRGADLRPGVHPVGERARLPRRREGDGVLRGLGILAPLHAAVGHAPGGQARLHARADRPRAAGQRHRLLSRRAGAARRAGGLAQPVLGDHHGAGDGPDRRPRRHRDPQARERGARPPVRHLRVAARARGLRAGVWAAPARRPVELQGSAERRAAPGDRPLLPRLDRLGGGPRQGLQAAVGRGRKRVWLAARFYERNYGGTTSRCASTPSASPARRA